MTIHLRSLRLYPATIAVVSLVGSVASPVISAVPVAEPYEQEFLVTAYYSPLPDQCCYARGDYEADILFNGEGTHGASGHEVFPGMIAAPPSYAFGTHIELPGLGVGRVEDRGGRIIEWEGGLHRIDLWMGHGEEGLKRALHFGAQITKGTVYPAGSRVPDVAMDITALPAPQSALSAAAGHSSAAADLLTDESAMGEKSAAVRKLQESLAQAGYFDHAVTGLYGDVTKEALAAFQADFGIAGDGSVADDATRTMLIARVKIADREPNIVPVGLGDSGAAVASAKRIMRSIGAYSGRTTDVYDENFAAQVLEFQIARGVVTDGSDPGAGRIGPATRQAITEAWRGMRIRTVERTVRRELIVKRALEEQIPHSTLARGDSGEDVAALQRMLARIGYFDPRMVNGTFGAQTASAVAAFQESREIATPGDRGAGVFGPQTYAALMEEAFTASMMLVKAEGIEKL